MGGDERGEPARLDQRGECRRTRDRRSSGRDCRSARRPAAHAGHWRPRARWPRAVVRRRTIPPAGGFRAGRDRDRRATRAPATRPGRAAGRRSSAAGRGSPAPRTPAASDGTGRRSRFRCVCSAVRLSSLMVEVAAPPILTSPASGRSNRPARWRSVDFPAPDGAISATDCPGKSSRLAPLKTSTVVSPHPYRRSTSSRVRAATRAASFIAQRFYRIELGRSPGRINRRRERQNQRHRDDGENVTSFRRARAIATGSRIRTERGWRR